MPNAIQENVDITFHAIIMTTFQLQHKKNCHYNIKKDGNRVHAFG